MAYKKWVIFIALALILSSGLMACSSESGDKADKGDAENTNNAAETAGQAETTSNMRPTVLYYQDADGYVVPVMRKIKWQEAIAKSALQAITDETVMREDIQKIGLLPSIPAGTQVNGISIHDGLATVDFNDGIMSCADAAEERNMVDAIVYTLAEFPTIDKVRLQVNGKIVKELKHGTAVDKPLEPAGINAETADKNLDLNKASKVTVYFTKTSAPNFACLVPVTRFTSASSANIADAIKELLKGPKENSSLTTSIPQGTELLGVQVKEGVAYINLSKEFEAVQNAQADMDMALKQLMMTVKQFDGVQKVKIQIDGKDVGSGENAIVEPIAVPAFANEY
ncbi:MAG: germination protein [Clostridiales bacterium]|jgi:germination protein M|nr:germination protein [Clostridiales bacterium]